jgi:hypothetical protein
MRRLDEVAWYISAIAKEIWATFICFHHHPDLMSDRKCR